MADEKMLIGLVAGMAFGAGAILLAEAITATYCAFPPVSDYIALNATVGLIALLAGVGIWGFTRKSKGRRDR
jgi:hypothetical protein